MCQLFYPETSITTVAGFNQAFQYEITALYPAVVLHIDAENMNAEMIKEEKALVLFGIFLEILTLMKQEQKTKLNSATVKYTQNDVRINIDYTGEAIRRKSARTATGPYDLGIFERAGLIGGRLEIKSIGLGQRRIKLVTPIN